ncbi:MAG: hypothetical protein ACRENB_07980 [Gemmatimonadales bacterium]
MRSFPSFLLALGMAALVSGCALITQGELDQEVRLAPGQTVQFAGTDLSLTFEEVVDDSRCPSTAVCVWIGNGVVKIESRRGETRLVHTLGTPSGPLEAVSGAYRIRILGLDPYPDGGPIPEEDYRLRLLVTID